MNTRSALADLERRSYRSYRARIETERRLRRVGLTWNAAQTALAVGLIAVSVLYLAYPDEQNTLMVVYLISLAVLALAVSVTVGALDYSGRAREMFRNYRSIQALSVRIESTQKSRLFISRRFLEQAQTEYDLLLDHAENHSQLDWDVFEAKNGPEKARMSKPSEESDDDKTQLSTGQNNPRRLLVRRVIPFALPSILVAIACLTAISAIVTVVA